MVGHKRSLDFQPIARRTRSRLHQLPFVNEILDYLQFTLDDESTIDDIQRRSLHSEQSLSNSTSTTTMPGTGSMATGTANEEKEQWEGQMIPGLQPDRVLAFPKNIITKLRYCSYGLFANTTSAAGYNFRANSVFDPDQTSAGHQPMYFDNYAAIWNRYRVLGSEIKVIWTPSADSSGTNIPSQGGPWIVGINGTTDSTNYATVGSTRM